MIFSKKSIRTWIGYAALSTATIAALVTTSVNTAHADVGFTGTTKLQGEVVITKPVTLTTPNSSALENAKVVINPTKAGEVINLGNLKVNEVEIKKSVTLAGTGLGNAKVILNPTDNNAIDLRGINSTNIVIANNKVTSLIVPDNAAVEIADSVDPTTLNVAITNTKNEPVKVSYVPTVVSATYTLDNGPITLDQTSGGYTIAGSISDITKLTNVSLKIKAASDVRITASDSILGGITGGLTLSPDNNGDITFNLNSNSNYVKVLNSTKKWLNILSDDNGKIYIDVANAQALLSKVDPTKIPDSQTSITLTVQEVKSLFSDVALAESIPNGDGSITVSSTKAIALYAGLKLFLSTGNEFIDVATLRTLLPLVGLPEDLTSLSRTFTFKIADEDNKSVDVPVTIKVTSTP